MSTSIFKRLLAVFLVVCLLADSGAAAVTFIQWTPHPAGALSPDLFNTEAMQEEALWETHPLDEQNAHPLSSAVRREAVEKPQRIVPVSPLAMVFRMLADDPAAIRYEDLYRRTEKYPTLKSHLSNILFAFEKQQWIDVSLDTQDSHPRYQLLEKYRAQSERLVSALNQHFEITRSDVRTVLATIDQAPLESLPILPVVTKAPVTQAAKRPLQRRGLTTRRTPRASQREMPVRVAERWTDQKSQAMEDEIVFALSIHRQQLEPRLKWPAGPVHLFIRFNSEGDHVALARVGFLFFMFDADFGNLPSDLQNQLRSNVILLTQDPRATAMSFNRMAYTMNLVSAMLHQNFSLKTVLDPAAGDGVASLAAFKLGAAFVGLNDYDPDLNRIARRNLQLNGITDTDFSISANDLREPAQVEAGLFKKETIQILLVNVGAWPSAYPINNQDVLSILDFLPQAETLVLAGYLTKYRGADYSDGLTSLQNDRTCLQAKGFESVADEYMRSSTGDEMLAWTAHMRRPRNFLIPAVITGILTGMMILLLHRERTLLLASGGSMLSHVGVFLFSTTWLMSLSRHLNYWTLTNTVLGFVGTVALFVSLMAGWVMGRMSRSKKSVPRSSYALENHVIVENIIDDARPDAGAVVGIPLRSVKHPAIRVLLLQRRNDSDGQLIILDRSTGERLGDAPVTISENREVYLIDMYVSPGNQGEHLMQRALTALLLARRLHPWILVGPTRFMSSSGRATVGYLQSDPRLETKLVMDPVKHDSFFHHRRRRGSLQMKWSA